MDCPKCGYPSKGEYKGLYSPSKPCDKCGYISNACSEVPIDKSLLPKEFLELMTYSSQVRTKLSWASGRFASLKDGEASESMM